MAVDMSKEAVEEFNKALSNKDWKTVGECYYYGKGIEKDYEKALEYYLEALYSKDDEENDKEYLFYTIGFMLFKGIGTLKNRYCALNNYLSTTKKYKSEYDTSKKKYIEERFFYAQSEDTEYDYIHFFENNVKCKEVFKDLQVYFDKLKNEADKMLISEYKTKIGQYLLNIKSSNKYYYETAMEFLIPSAIYGVKDAIVEVCKASLTGFSKNEEDYYYSKNLTRAKSCALELLCRHFNKLEKSDFELCAQALYQDEPYLAYGLIQYAYGIDNKSTNTIDIIKYGLKHNISFEKAQKEYKLDKRSPLDSCLHNASTSNIKQISTNYLGKNLEEILNYEGISKDNNINSQFEDKEIRVNLVRKQALTAIDIYKDLLNNFDENIKTIIDFYNKTRREVIEALKTDLFDYVDTLSSDSSMIPLKNDFLSLIDKLNEFILTDEKIIEGDYISFKNNKGESFNNILVLAKEYYGKEINSEEIISKFESTIKNVGFVERNFLNIQAGFSENALEDYIKALSYFGKSKLDNISKKIITEKLDLKYMPRYDFNLLNPHFISMDEIDFKRFQEINYVRLSKHINDYLFAPLVPFYGYEITRNIYLYSNNHPNYKVFHDLNIFYHRDMHDKDCLEYLKKASNLNDTPFYDVNIACNTLLEKYESETKAKKLLNHKILASKEYVMAVKERLDLFYKEGK